MSESARLVICLGPACAQKGAADLLTAVRAVIEHKALASQISLSASGCRSGCDRAIVAGLFPGRVRLEGLNPDGAADLIEGISTELGGRPRPSVLQGLSHRRRHHHRGALPSWRRWS